VTGTGTGIRLRLLARDDFPVLSEWLREPATEWWWHDEPEPDAIERTYGPSIDGVDPTVVLLASSGADPVGLVQWYWLRDEQEYREQLSAALPVPDDAVSIDYLIGDASRRGRGLGRAMITEVLGLVWAAGASTVLVPVNATNAPSRAVLERCGLRAVGEADLEPDNPAHGREHVVYGIDRPASSRSGSSKDGSASRRSGRAAK
jgi:aminoglycoside 6'-N-acetyltransferase